MTALPQIGTVHYSLLAGCNRRPFGWAGERSSAPFTIP